MGKSVKEIYDEASELSENDRAQLAGLLLESIEHDADSDVEKVWAAEIDRRVGMVESGSATLVAWEDVKRRTHEKLKRNFD